MKPILAAVSSKTLYLDIFHKIYYKDVVIFQFIAFEGEGGKWFGLQISLTTAKRRNTTKNLTSFLTVKTESTRKNYNHEKCQKGVEIIEYRIRFLTAFVVFDIFNLKVVHFFPIRSNLFSQTLGFRPRDATDHKTLSQSWQELKFQDAKLSKNV